MNRRIDSETGRLFPMTILIILFMIIACKKDDNMEENLRCPIEALDGANDNVVGKWKLAKAKVVFQNPRTEDYSCDEIIYDFRADGILVISGGASSDSIGYPEGQYTYAFTADKLFEWVEESYTLSIDETKIASGINNNQLILNSSPLDGPILYFVRIQ